MRARCSRLALDFPVRPVDLRDALRQRKLSEQPVLVVRLWRQVCDEKYFVNLVAPHMEPTTQRKFRLPVAVAYLERLDAVVKDMPLTTPLSLFRRGR